jgi:hypothetical protein
MRHPCRRPGWSSISIHPDANVNAHRASDMLLSLVEPQQEQAIARMQIAIKVDSRPPRAMGARLSSRLRWWRRLEEV